MPLTSPARRAGRAARLWTSGRGSGRRMVSEHARRVLAVAGSSWSFDQASKKLLELCRIKVSNDTIRAVCDEEGERAGKWVRSDHAHARMLAGAAGEWEFSTDGVRSTPPAAGVRCG